MNRAFNVILQRIAMNSACFASVFIGLAAQVIYGQTASQLEAFERYAKQPTAQVTWSKEVGRIETDQAHAVIMALIVEDATQTPKQMRGVRIDLSEGDKKDQLYTSEEYLDRLIKALNEITDGAPSFLEKANGNACFGSGVFWQQQGHAFSASQCVTRTFEGLSVSGGFHFPGGMPAPFAGAVERGRDELKRH
jgi:hypothetical protein